MSDIAERVLAAIAEKETMALATSGLTWRTHDGWVESGGHCASILNEHEKPLVAWLPTFQFPGWDIPGPWANAKFIADNDPESVLRRCAADREIVALHKPVSVYVESWNKPKRQVCEQCAEHVGEGMYSGDYLYPCDTIKLLARGYGVQP